MGILCKLNMQIDLWTYMSMFMDWGILDLCCGMKHLLCLIVSDMGTMPLIATIDNNVYCLINVICTAPS